MGRFDCSNVEPPRHGKFDGRMLQTFCQHVGQCHYVSLRPILPVSRDVRLATGRYRGSVMKGSYVLPGHLEGSGRRVARSAEKRSEGLLEGLHPQLAYC